MKTLRESLTEEFLELIKSDKEIKDEIDSKDLKLKVLRTLFDKVLDSKQKSFDNREMPELRDAIKQVNNYIKNELS